MSDTFQARGSRFTGRRRPAGDDDNLPDPRNYEEVAAYVDSLPPEEAAEYIRENAGNMPDHVIDMLDAHLANEAAADQGPVPQGGQIPDAPEEAGVPVVRPGRNEESPAQVAATQAADDAAQQVAPQTVDWRENVGEAQAAAAELIAQAAATGDTLLDDDLMSAIEDLMPDGLTPAQRGQWTQEVQDGAREQAIDKIAASERAQGNSDGADAAAQDAVNNTVVSRHNTPRWMFEQAKASGQMVGGTINKAAQDRFLGYYNDLYGSTFRTFDELVASTDVLSEDVTQEIQTVWDAALSGQDPLAYENMQDRPLEVQVNQRGGLAGAGTRTVTVSTEELQRLQGMGLNLNQIRELTREAYMFGGDTQDLTSISAVERYYRERQNRLGLGTDIQEVRSINAEKRLELDQVEEELARIQGQDWGPDASGKRARLAELNKKRTELRMYLGPGSGTGGTASRGPGIVGIQNRYNEGNQRYQNKPLAVIYSVDRALAARIAATGGDPAKMDADDVSEAADILRGSGIARAGTSGGIDNYWVNDADLVAGIIDAGGGVGGPAARQRGGGGGGGGGGRVRRLVDETAVKESVHELWRGMFREDAPDGLASEFAKQLQAALDATPEGQEFDPNSRLRQWIKGQGVYDQLYGRKSEGVSEEEWQSQFMAAQGSILGDEIPNDFDPVRAGMESGQYQTAVGAAVGTKQAWDNSTWMGRLAQAAMVVQDNT